MKALLGSRLAQLAAEVAVVAPIRKNRYSATAYVPWGIVNDIRAELDRLGIDWRAAAATLRKGKGYGS